MSQALIEPETIAKLVVVDMSPAKGKISPDYAKYIEGMREIEQMGIKSKKEADVILQKYEQVWKPNYGMMKSEGTRLNRPYS